MKKYLTDEIKQIPILDVAKRLGLNPVNKKVPCFIHKDTKPSLSFWVEANTWKCFGCNESGDNISLVRKYYNISFVEALEWFDFNFHTNALKQPSSKKKVYNRKKIIVKKNTNKQPLEENRKGPDSEIYEWLINNTLLSAIGKEYLFVKRGFNQKIIDHFQIRDITNPSIIFNKAIKIFGVERLEKAGLLKYNGQEVKFVWWDHVILFPFMNKQNVITYLQGRRLIGNEPKYVNLIGVKADIFNRKVLANITKDDIIYICEGITDCMSATQHGLNAVGILGASGFKKEWVELFKDFRVRLIPDSDKAGYQFAETIKQYFLDIDKYIEIVKLQEGTDFSDYLFRKK